MANPLDVPNRPKMYRIRPYFEIKKVRLPACMYLMKPVHQLTNIAPSSGEVGITVNQATMATHGYFRWVWPARVVVVF